LQTVCVDRRSFACMLGGNARRKLIPASKRQLEW
jgi:hypothetical protein